MKYPKGKYAWTVKVGEKGQFVIPKEAREVFDIHPCDTLIVPADIKRGIAIPPKMLLQVLLIIFLAAVFRRRTRNECDCNNTIYKKSTAI